MVIALDPEKPVDVPIVTFPPTTSAAETACDIELPSSKLPLRVRGFDCVSVPVNPVPVMAVMLIVAPTVTVPPPELPSKKAVVEACGTAAPPPPPDELAQCVAVELSQVPVPPTQKRLATLIGASAAIIPALEALAPSKVMLNEPAGVISPCPCVSKSASKFVELMPTSVEFVSAVIADAPPVAPA